MFAPNGLCRHFAGDATGTQAEIKVRYQPKSQKSQLIVRIAGSQPAALQILHNAYARRRRIS